MICKCIRMFQVTTLWIAIKDINERNCENCNLWIVEMGVQINICEKKENLSMTDNRAYMTRNMYILIEKQEKTFITRYVITNRMRNKIQPRFHLILKKFNIKLSEEESEPQ
ncbi:hypothetical protein WUBG_07618 [Wuchereria bancrofti]|uniref:Uncharacterized protein n=1 Tax=Wuchereria bancrofti TaxID=6293 RepID=J9F288_WUCBA|nr:hypothetical protein WUBG_07618 [Wuchereria bancrofti]